MGYVLLIHVPHPVHFDRDNSMSDNNVSATHRCFSITISALDLATTPFTLERAQQQELDITQDHTLMSFLENYQPYPGFQRKRFPTLHRGLQTYETRILKPFIRTASQSQSILIQIIQDDSRLDGLLLRRRVVPIDSVKGHVIDNIVGVCNRHRSLEALDLATRDSVAVFKFDQDYNKLWKSRFQSHLNRWRRRVATKDSEVGIFIFDQDHDKLWETHFQSRLNRQQLKIIIIYALLLILIVSFVSWFVFIFSNLDFTTSDRSLCGGVNPGPYPCTITPNPDVAGIGIRIALYMQTFLLAVLLSFSPKEATPVSWILVFTSTSFVLSGIIAAATSKLTLYHATLTAKMQGLPITVLTIVEFFPPRRRGPYIFLLHIFRLAVSLVMLTWYTVIAPCFGSQPECNAYVVTHGLLFSSSEMAIARAPRVWSLLLVTITFLFRLFQIAHFPKGLTIALHSLFSSNASRKWYGLPEGLIIRKTPTSWRALFFWAVVSILDDNSTPSFIKRSAQVSQAPVSLPCPVTATRTTTNSPRPPLSNKLQILSRIALNIRHALSYPKIWRLMIAFAIGGLLVSDIEATISSNTVDVEESAWTYGQVLAVILTAIPVVQVLQLLGLVPSPRKRMKKVGHKEKVL